MYILAATIKIKKFCSILPAIRNVFGGYCIALLNLILLDTEVLCNVHQIGFQVKDRTELFDLISFM